MTLIIEEGYSAMIKMIDIKVKDQYSQILDAKAVLSTRLMEQAAEGTPVSRHIDHIFVNGEMIQPSIEFLYESQTSPSIYKVIEA